MKIKITEKQLKNSYKNIISVNYCGLQYLLQRINANYYTAGIYGWKSDVYVIDNNTVIATGYSPIGNIKPKYTIIDKYNKAAEKVYKNWFSDRHQEKRLKILLNNFAKEVLTNV